jgi:tetratricopeptide (TPR) repeat protein
MGLAQFDPDGSFLGYIGAPKVKVDLVTKFWQFFSTKEQKAKMNRFVPTEYSNIAIDGEGFLYAATEKIAERDIRSAARGGTASETALPVKRLNAAGKDILKRNGLTVPMGNIDTGKRDWVSRITDVAVGPAGSYTLLDTRTATLYTYSGEGVLLHAFGERGKGKNQFASPAAVDYQGNNILVLDSGLKSVMVFSPTEYGAMLIEAIDAEYSGDFDAAYALWGNAVKLNANFAYAYTGLGKTAYEKGEYQLAMAYFANALDDADYSRAKEKRRTETMRTVFPFLFFGVVFLILFGTLKNGLRRIMSVLWRRA